MVKRENPEIDLTADEHDREPAAKRVRVEEPYHLLCPITHEMFRDPVMVVVSGHTYERAAIERRLREHGTDPLTRDRTREAPVTNRGIRNAVQAWLDENPGVTPDGWDTREMLPPSSPPPIDFYGPDLEVLHKWRESCPELRDLWRGDDARHWAGVTWSDGRVTDLDLSNQRLSGPLPFLEGLTHLQKLDIGRNDLVGSIPEGLFQGMNSLRTVTLSCNKLYGTIPERLFEGLTSLKEVNLAFNSLSGSICEHLFEGLNSLHTVKLYGNVLLDKRIHTISDRLQAIVEL